MIRRCCLVTVLLVAAWAVRIRLGTPEPVMNAGSLWQFPSTIGNWRGQDEPLEPEFVRGLGVDDYLNRHYHSDRSSVGLYVAYYRSQQPGRAFHSPMNCLPGSGWEPVKKEWVDLGAGSDKASAPVRKVVIDKGIDRQLVLYWYQTPNRVTGSEYWSKVFLVREAFQSGRTDVALVRIMTPIDPRDPGGEASALTQAFPFAERVLPLIRERLFQS